ncbi:hypothetical protein EON83_25650 [bacterium]|nr:MAG: hypothetical protein EON83_25650 [bacterium]
MTKSYYQLWYRLDNNDRYLIWYDVQEADKELDGIVLDAEGRIPVFTSPEALSDYAQARSLVIEDDDEPLLHDLDVVAHWLETEEWETETLAEINCEEFLAAWNLFADVSRSIKGSFDGDHDHTGDIYGKLFWGNNLPSLTPEGECYIPDWSEQEQHIIRDVMSQGLQMFRDNTSQQ